MTSAVELLELVVEAPEGEESENKKFLAETRIIGFLSFKTKQRVVA